MTTIDWENLKHPMTWIALGGTLFWIMLIVQIIIGGR
jgi:hypothetical protein